MRALAEAWPDREIVQQLVAQIPWGHNVRILDMVKSQAEREWYIHRAIEHGWSRNVLVIHIESGLYRRQGKAITNLQTLPATAIRLAQQILKDPYNFDFLTLTQEAQERDLERELLAHLRQFLMNSALASRSSEAQVPLAVGDEDFKLDLLFYHLKLSCFVVIDLKMGPFKPEYAGKMNFYLSAVDDILRHPDDSPALDSFSANQKWNRRRVCPSRYRNRSVSPNSAISKSCRTCSKAHSRRSKNWKPSSRKVPIVTRLMTMFQP